MWIFLSDAYLSIVQSKTSRNALVVRARRPGDIEAVFPNAKVVTIPGRDYQFRADIPRELVAQAISDEVMSIRHTNFKDSVTDHDYHDACSKVWNIMSKLQPIPPYSHGNVKQSSARIKRLPGL
jgi:hypothetical protein